MIFPQSFHQIIDEIKAMNQVFERLEWIGANWDNEYGYFVEEIDEFIREWRKDNSLVGATDALVDICVFAVWALHKEWKDTSQIFDIITSSTFIDIYSISSTSQYKENIWNILFSIFFTLSLLFSHQTTTSLFHEVYLSNMSKLKDWRPVPWNLPGKFGKNMETYFKPNLLQYVQNTELWK